ncbi:MAG: hypothetical protein ACRDQ2_04400 [Gaiellales bacterium]
MARGARPGRDAHAARVGIHAIPSVRPSAFHAPFSIFLESLEDSALVETHNQKRRVVDVSQGAGIATETATSLPRLEKAVSVQQGDSCFVMMPFADPVGGYYKAIYEPAIQKAGLKPVRADDDIFSTGKIIDQVWSGIHSAKVLVAELTGRNPNVFYEPFGSSCELADNVESFANDGSEP